MMLKDKVIIVTGGSGLLGQTMLTNIKEKGGIAINADINSSVAIADKNIRCDVTDIYSIKNVINTVLSEYGRIDGLVNNAYPRTTDWGKEDFDKESMVSWRKNIDLQLNSYVEFCQEIIKIMMDKRQGAIVNIASIYGVVGNDFSVYEGTNMKSPAGYAAIKGAIINLSRYLASFYGKYNIRVNCVSPGGIFDSQNPVFVENYEKKVPLKRMGTPKDIAPAVSFLLADESAYITGHNLIVDGGWTAI